MTARAIMPGSRLRPQHGSGIDPMRGQAQGENATMSAIVAPPTGTVPTNAQIFKVALASIIGSVIEQYDFLVTGVIAATIWGGIFFKLPGLAAVAATIPAGRLGTPADLAGACLFLASPLASYVSGSALEVHGGGESPPFLAAVEEAIRPGGQ